uniref:Variant surface glycoprotein 1508 n=1 Tax=Trypanosoma brucei TaxID=5691 RepID=M4TBT0_9TRYP|nr:variant surface glycoprotein 1508 [Trypanosoma brucei]
MLLTFAATVVLIRRPVRSINAGDNGNLFLDLCAPVALPSSKTPELASKGTADADFQEILKLNATLSDDTWRKKFEKPHEGQERPKYSNKGENVDEIRKLRWDGWTKAEDELDKEKESKTMIKKAAIDGISEHEKGQLSALLQPIAEEDAAAILQLTSGASADSKLTENAVKKLLEAAYSQGVTQLSELTLDNLKANNGNPGTRTLFCVADTPETTKAKTLAALLYCICAAESTDGSGNFKECADDIPAAQSTHADLANADTDTTAIINTCPDSPSMEITASEILTSLAAFLGRGTPKQGKIIFCQLASQGCAGQSSSGLCIVYKTAAKAGTTALTAAAWGTKLVEAAELIAEQKRRNNKITKTTSRLADLREQAFNLQPQL